MKPKKWVNSYQEKAPQISRKSSIYDIKRVESENDVSDYRPRQQPQNPTAARTYLR
jgi:hypothetical protein